MRTLLVGNGEMATAYAQVLRNLPQAELVGVVGRNPVNLRCFAERAALPYFSDSLESAIRDTQPDVAIAAVSLDSIPKMYSRLLNTDMALLLEKPLGLDLSQAKHFVAMSENRNKPAFVAMNRRYYSSTQLLLEQLEDCSGSRFVQISDQQSYEYPASRGYSDYVLRRWAFANSIHLIDLGCFLVRGRATEVISSGWDSSLLRPSMLSARINFDSGDCVSYTALWNQPGPWSVSVTTDNKHWQLRPLEILHRRAQDGTWTSYGVSKLDTEFKPGIYLETAALADAMRGKSVGLPTARENLASVELLHALYGSGGGGVEYQES